ncbi:unnamed protein product [Symbiodinium natans]|uniref:Uncharacterized protein n=1 Tax=Symbiodinium natans TaxID=878477 RepID=A0A812PTY4_9DINO|nr:unnamed protein product [Symbiodinium natans]
MTSETWIFVPLPRGTMGMVMLAPRCSKPSCSGLWVSVLLVLPIAAPPSSFRDSSFCLPPSCPLAPPLEVLRMDAHGPLGKTLLGPAHHVSIRSNEYVVLRFDNEAMPVSCNRATGWDIGPRRRSEACSTSNGPGHCAPTHIQGNKTAGRYQWPSKVFVGGLVVQVLRLF